MSHARPGERLQAPGAVARKSASAELCLLCPQLCTSACPIAESTARAAFAPWAKVSMGALCTTPGETPGAAAAEAVAACTGCLRCTAHCPHGNDVPTLLEQARGAAVRAGAAPLSSSQLAMRFSIAGHGEEQDLGSLFAALCLEQASRAPEPKHPAPGAKTGRAMERAAPPELFAGCDALARGAEGVRRALHVARALGAPLQLVAMQALCCGTKLAEGGHPELFRAHARRTLLALAGPQADRSARARPRHLVFLSAACARGVLERWPQVDAQLPEGSRVEHLTTYLARALAEHPARARPQLPGAVALHDSCELVRGLGDLSSARALLTAAMAGGVREPLRCGAETSCCGAGSLLPRTLPAVSRELARARQAELAACDAPAVASSGECAQHLGVPDLVELLARWLGV